MRGELFGGSSALVQMSFGAQLFSSSLQPSQMDAAEYRAVTALELSYLQLTAADLHHLHQQGRRKTFWNESQEIQKSLPAFFPLLLQTLSLSQSEV